VGFRKIAENKIVSSHIAPGPHCWESGKLKRLPGWY
jgi:hypothetical protein